ncbi:MAG: DUF3990 domain-containing protein [Bacteroidales bacterium]|nr:DUF3990 domain-containing protein [Bacteroidales bacterium]
MIIYHGSLGIVELPKILETNRPLDFGTGFYTTTSIQQARRWVELRMEQNNASMGFINIYEYTPKKSLHTRLFRSANEAWVDFVHANRTVQDYNHDYDIVTGPVANDNVYLSFNLYESGIISKRELIRRLKTYKLVDQLLFHTERSLETVKYIGYKEVRL